MSAEAAIDSAVRCARPGSRRLAAELVNPLRERLERGIDEADGDNDTIAKRARGVYREWKTKHIDDQLDDIFRLAYGRGALAALPPAHRSRGSSTRRSAVARLRGQLPGR